MIPPNWPAIMWWLREELSWWIKGGAWHEIISHPRRLEMIGAVALGTFAMIMLLNAGTSTRHVTVTLTPSVTSTPTPVSATGTWPAVHVPPLISITATPRTGHTHQGTSTPRTSQSTPQPAPSVPHTSTSPTPSDDTSSPSHTTPVSPPHTTPPSSDPSPSQSPSDPPATSEDPGPANPVVTVSTTSNQPVTTPTSQETP